jgi:hypothetical protein
MKQLRKFPTTRSITASTRRHLWCILAAPCLFAACAICAVPVCAAQTAKPSAAVAQKPAAAPVPQAPVSLASQPPTAATVTFHDGKLKIQASNSELLQILQAITAQTGMKVQGSPGSHRIFGTYGPGEPNAVLSDLLSGFDFNFLVVGRARNGAPQQLILAGAGASAPEPAPPVKDVQPAPPVNDVQPAPPETLPQPQAGDRPTYETPRGGIPSRRNMPAPAPGRVATPQQILKELEAMHAGQQQHP